MLAARGECWQNDSNAIVLHWKISQAGSTPTCNLSRVRRVPLLHAIWVERNTDRPPHTPPYILYIHATINTSAAQLLLLYFCYSIRHHHHQACPTGCPHHTSSSIIIDPEHKLAIISHKSPVHQSSPVIVYDQTWSVFFRTRPAWIVDSSVHALDRNREFFF